MVAAKRRYAGIVHLGARNAPMDKQRPQARPVPRLFRQEGEGWRFEPSIYLGQSAGERGRRRVDARMRNNGKELMQARPRNGPCSPSFRELRQPLRGSCMKVRIGAMRVHQDSKYPPAEPGALVLEPLEAAYPCCSSQASIHSVECLTPHQQLSRCNLQFLLFALHLVWPNLSSSSIDRTPLRVLGGSRFGASPTDRRCRPPDTSNFCCLPGRAGGTPIGV